jgi:hypothetical protein
VIALLAGCSSSAINLSGTADAATDVAPDPATVPPPAQPRKLDILFLVDNSVSVDQEQENLGRNFGVFLEALRRAPGGLPDLHIGVVSSDLGAGSRPLANGGCPRPGGDRGILQSRPWCGLDGHARFMTSSAGGTVNNFTNPPEAVFSCLAALGGVGCGYEHVLQAVRVALYETITPENAGFLRADAFLSIVILTDEDDCSADPASDLFTDDAAFPGTSASFRCSQVGHLCNGAPPPIAPFDVPLESCQANPAGRLIKVSEIVASIRALKRLPEHEIQVDGIFGWPSDPVGARYRYVATGMGLDVAPICQSSNGEAAVGLRLKSFVESFGPASSFYSICTNDFGPILQRIGQSLASRL